MLTMFAPVPAPAEGVGDGADTRGERTAGTADLITGTSATPASAADLLEARANDRDGGAHTHTPAALLPSAGLAGHVGGVVHTEAAAPGSTGNRNGGANRDGAVNSDAGVGEFCTGSTGDGPSLTAAASMSHSPPWVGARKRTDTRSSLGAGTGRHSADARDLKRKTQPLLAFFTAAEEDASERKEDGSSPVAGEQLSRTQVLGVSPQAVVRPFEQQQVADVEPPAESEKAAHAELAAGSTCTMDDAGPRPGTLPGGATAASPASALPGEVGYGLQVDGAPCPACRALVWWGTHLDFEAGSAEALLHRQCLKFVFGADADGHENAGACTEGPDVHEGNVTVCVSLEHVLQRKRRGRACRCDTAHPCTTHTTIL